VAWPLPDKLPEATGADTGREDQSVIGMAAAYARRVPDGDRDL